MILRKTSFLKIFHFQEIIEEHWRYFSADVLPQRKNPSAGFNFSRRPRTPPPIPAPAVATPRISSLKISENKNITS